MKNLILFLSLVLAMSITICAEQQTQQSAYKVLFIGNSLTYYNDVPSMVSALYKASNEGEAMQVDMIAEGGYSLAQHLALPLVSKTITDNKYDAVVIQDFGGWPFCSTTIPTCSEDSHSLANLIKIIKKSGATPIWYSTYQINPDVQKIMSQEVNKISNKLEVKLADVGASLHKYMLHNKFNKVFSKDSHLNYTGSLIAAATILHSISGKNIPNGTIVNEICTDNWRGMNLKADKLASMQVSKGRTCENFIQEDFVKVLLAVKTIY